MSFVTRFTASVVGLVALVASASTDVRASVAIAASVDDLAKASSLVVVVTPVEQRTSWEGGRIVTDSRVHIEDRVADERDAHRNAGEVWVRTLGGVADGIGQLVDGEAKLAVDRPSLLFLRPGQPPSQDPSRETLVVVAHAQGQYDVESKSPSEASRPLRTLVARKADLLVKRAWAPPLATPLPSAMQWLHGKSLDEAKVAIADAWSRTHAK
jgi:hypothetical protein